MPRWGMMVSGRTRARRGYAAFLQNAGVGWGVVVPERCSGLVCDAPLGHGVFSPSGHPSPYFRCWFTYMTTMRQHETDFDQQVRLKYQVYNSLFLTLPFDLIHQT